MEHERADEEGRREPQARPQAESILDSVERRTGGPARVSLSDAAADETPITGPAAEGGGFMPRKRGDYHVLGEIARGGMGRILRAHDGDLGRDVAIKVLDPRLAGRADVLRRFVEEAQIGGQLQHPGIVPVYELGLMADERPYFTMKLVKGRTLAELLASRRSPDEGRGRLLQVFEAVCQTVAYAHTKGVIHRDLKPANVMVGSFGEVQVVDWGLAKVLRRGGVDDELRARREDRTVIETVRSGPEGAGSDSLAGSVLGTPAYMPPEQARGEVDSLDERADVFALGAMLCELLTGRPPYVEREGQSLLQQASQGRLEDAYARLESCGAERGLVELARACLAPAPGARLHNGEAVARGVHDHLTETGERARRAELEAAEARVRAGEERKARRLTLALAATGAIATFAIGGGWIVRERREREEVARIERGLDEVRAQVSSLQGEGQAEEAVQAARSALLLVEGRQGDDALRASAEALVAQAEQRATDARLERERDARDAKLLRRLDELRLEASVPLSVEEHVVLDEAFDRAFREWGLDVDADLLASLDHLRASGLEAELAPALDDWAAVRRWAYGWRSLQADQLNALAVDLDPDEVRVRLREALIERDTGTVLQIANDPRVLDMPASTLWVLGSALRSQRQIELSLSLLQRAAARHPTDLRLRIAAMASARDLSLWEVAARHVGVAAAMRPDLLELSVLEGDCLGRAARYPAAVRAFERVLEEDPSNERALEEVGWSLFPLGEFARAERALERLADLRPLDLWEEALLAFVQLHQGEIDVDAFDGRMDELTRVNPEITGMQALGLLGQARDAGDLERVAALIEQAPTPLRGWDDIRAELLLAQGRPQEALDATWRLAEYSSERPDVELMLGVMALRARALAALGRRDEARAWLVAAASVFRPLRGDEPEAWEGSFVLRDLRRAEAALGD